ncbi:MAG: hypothetical protein WBA53_01010 [Burkholderiaceae bacterium]
MFRAVVVFMAFCLASLSVVAAETLRITKGPKTPWAVGDRSHVVVTSDGRLGVQLTVKKSPNGGQSYYVLSFETRSGDPVNFSARVSDRPPQRTHFAARAEPGRPYQWGEHLPSDLDTVYVMYRPSK